MMKSCQKINLQEPQSNRKATANFVNLIRTSTVCCKILEHIIHSQDEVMKHFKTHDILGPVRPATWLPQETEKTVVQNTASAIGVRLRQIFGKQ